MIKPDPVQTARYILGFAWIYHGLFPKLVHVAPLEKVLTASLGFSEHVSGQITVAAGIAEILFGVTIILFYKNRLLIKLNMLALAALLLFVAVQVPWLLIEAFNPVTTNIALLGLSYVLLRHHKSGGA